MPDTNEPSQTGTNESSEEQDAKVTSFYTVAKYDPQADPAKDLAATVTQATSSGKRIILEIGGDW